MIRKATPNDLSRIAEILVFTKRMNYRIIFNNDQVTFVEMQVIPTAEEYKNYLNNIWVYDDGFVKAMLRLSDNEIVELYVDQFFQNEGIGKKLIDFAKLKNAFELWVLEKNVNAVRFYEANGFKKTSLTKKRK